MKTPESLYIHIPFCKKKCLYCDFYSVAIGKDLISDYVDILCKQISKLALRFSTVYIGGGTPTVLGLKLWEKLLISLKRRCKQECEFSVEANPESLDDSKLELFFSSGVNRLSIGVQSLDDIKLKKLGRIHSVNRAKKAIFQARKKNFTNINIDLIFGVWGESLTNWAKELKEAAILPITHMSVYGLTFEENTLLFKKIKKNEIMPLADDQLAQMYKYNIGYLPKQGFFQYEVSNFSKKTFECSHNLNYWQNGAYLGLGPSAVSYLSGVREQYCSDVDKYVGLIKQAKNAVIFKEKLSPERRARETAALKIRTKEGIDFEWFKDNTTFDFLELNYEALRPLIQKRLIILKKHKNVEKSAHLSKKGFLFCDSVSEAFL